MKIAQADVARSKLLDLHCENCDFEWFCVEICRCPDCRSANVVIGRNTD